MSTRVSIAQVKRDITELVNRVIYAGERIILTSRGKTKAALISMEDYELLLNSETAEGIGMVFTNSCSAGGTGAENAIGGLLPSMITACLDETGTDRWN